MKGGKRSGEEKRGWEERPGLKTVKRGWRNDRRDRDGGGGKGTLVPCDSYPDHMTSTLQQSRL